MKKKKKVRRVVSKQKIFCFISFIFILTCCFWYGGRAVYFYLDSKKDNNNVAYFADNLKRENHDKDTFRKSDEEYYFYQDAKNNYFKYSNLMWRIIKINEDNSILLVTDDYITNLAYGVDVDYKDSPILKWLNVDDDSYSGVLEKKLNSVNQYLVKTSVCTDDINDVEKISCKNVNKNNYIALLSVEDYIKTGGKKSFINNGSISYLANKKDESSIWYIDNDGSLNSSSGDDILGLKATITMSPTISIKSGDGSKDNPYFIEDNTSIFGSFVKLDEDLWRVYDFNDEEIKLVATDYVKDVSRKTESTLETTYSKNSYKHNDTVYGSLAYYLNHTYFDSLKYKNLILNSYYYNGYYGEDNNYNLKELFNDKIDTHVSIPSVGDVILNHDLSNYFTSTGTYQNSTSVYVQKDNSEINIKKIGNEARVVPCITIKREVLKNGSGTSDDPYTME